MLLESLEKQIREIPSFWGIAWQIALVIFVNDARRLYLLSLQYASTSIMRGVNMLVTIAVILILGCLCLARPALRFSRIKPLVVVVGIALSASTWLVYGAGLFVEQYDPSAHITYTYSLFTACCSMLIILCAERLEPLRMRQRFLVVGVSFVCLAVLEILATLLRVRAAMLLLVISPLVASVLQLRATPARMGDGPVERTDTAKSRPLIELVLAPILFLFSLSLLGNLRYSVEHATPITEDLAFIMQPMHALGIALVGVVFIVAAGKLWSRGIARYLCLMIPACYGIAYMILQIGGPQFACVAVMPLEFMTKSAVVFPLFLLRGPGKRYMPTVCASLILYRLGQLAGTYLLIANIVTLDNTAYNLLEVMLVTVLLGLSIAFVLVRPAWQADAGVVLDPSSVSSDELRMQAIHTVAASFGLTPRETDILQYLADGWRSNAIAERLFLSQTTVKNHMGRIYKKLDVHTQQDIMLLVERQAERLSKQLQG